MHDGYFPAQTEIESWHRRWRWRRLVRLVRTDALPSSLPKCIVAAKDHAAAQIHLAPDEIARLEPAAEMLRDFQLWPLPASQPRVIDATYRSPLISAAIDGDVGWFERPDGLAAALADGGTLEEADGRGLTALMHACHSGRA